MDEIVVDGPPEDLIIPSRLRMTAAMAATSLLYLSAGAVVSWTSPMIPLLQLSWKENTIIGSVYTLGVGPGHALVPYCFDRYGRKRTLYGFLACFVISWSLLIHSENFYMIVLARIIGGIGVGGTFGGVYPFINEMSLSNIRGRANGNSFAVLEFGIMAMMSVGPFLSFRAVSYYGLIIATIFGVPFYFVPESAYYYLKKGRESDARNAITKLRGYGNCIAMEIEMSNIRSDVTPLNEPERIWWHRLNTYQAKNALSMGLLLTTLQVFSGSAAIIAYGQTLFTSTDLPFSPYLVPIIMALTAHLSMLSPQILNRYVTVKNAYIFSGIGATLLLSLLGLLLSFKQNGIVVYPYSVFSVLTLIVYSFLISVVIGPLTWPLTDEILPLNVQRIGSAICGIAGSLMAFGMITCFSAVSNIYNHGYSVAFFVLGGISFFTTAGLKIVLPESTGLTFQEVQRVLNNQPRRQQQQPQQQ